MAENAGNPEFTVAEVKVPFVADVDSLKKAQEDFDQWLEGVPDKITKALEPMLSGLKEALDTATKLGEKLGENQKQDQGSSAPESGKSGEDGGIDNIATQEELQSNEMRRIGFQIDELVRLVQGLVDNGNG